MIFIYINIIFLLYFLQFFAIQNYYTCWTGPTEQIKYSRDGESGGCWPEKDMDYGPHIVGQYSSNMVYMWSDM